jgi:hypothetical protein
MLGALLLAWTADPVSARSSWQDETEKPAAQAGDDATQEETNPDEAAQQEAEEDWSGLSQDEALKKVDELDKQFNDQLAEFRKAFREAAPEDRAKLRSQMPQPEPLIGKFQRLADLFPKTEVAGKSLLWIVQHQRSGIDYDHALATLFEQHSDLPELKSIVAMLQYRAPSAQITETFEDLIAHGTNRDLVGIAQYAFLQYQKRVEQTQQMLIENPERADALAQAYGAEQLEYVRNFEVLDGAQRLAKLEELAAEFGDVEIANGRTLGESIEGEIFEAKYLQIGMVAPDIEGEDIEGTPFKLSDYRGKVVLLDFWGDW